MIFFLINVNLNTFLVFDTCIFCRSFRSMEIYLLCCKYGKKLTNLIVLAIIVCHNCMAIMTFSRYFMQELNVVELDQVFGSGSGSSGGTLQTVLVGILINATWEAIKAVVPAVYNKGAGAGPDMTPEMTAVNGGNLGA